MFPAPAFPMIHERTTGIILRTRPLTESSLIIHWITPDLGRIATVAKGAHRPNSPFRGRLDLFYEADFSFRRSRRSDLHLLLEILVRNYHPEIRSQMQHLELVSQFSRAIEHHTETETPIPEIYQLVHEALHALSHQPGSPLASAAFDLKLRLALGVQPNLAQSLLSPGSRLILQRILELPLSLLERLKPSPEQIREIQNFLRSLP